MKLEISLFKFDKNSDYLPYYTKHFLKTKEEKNLLDILNILNEEQELGFENDENFDLVVNGVYVKAGITIDELVENFGKELTIEPISIRRACDDLLINDEDFTSKLSLLEEFATEEEKANYASLKPYFYASNTLNHYADYIGDSTLILAADIIEERKSNIKHKILSILNDQEVGAQYYTSLKNRIYNFDLAVEEKIFKLQEMLKVREDLDKQNFRVNKTLIINFGEFDENYEVKHDFKDFNIAYYSSKGEEKYTKLLNSLNAKLLNLDSSKLDLAKGTFNKNPEITFKVACTILLDAFDNSADFIVVDSEDDFYIFDYNRKELEKACGRDVLIPVIHINELQKLASGNHKEAKETLDKHQVNPEII